MLIGYARVSTADQSLTLQIDALEEAECDRVFQDQVSGIVNTRSDLKRGNSPYVSRSRDRITLVVWNRDRLSSSMRDLIETDGVAANPRDLQLKSLLESIRLLPQVAVS